MTTVAYFDYDIVQLKNEEKNVFSRNLLVRICAITAFLLLIQSMTLVKAQSYNAFDLERFHQTLREGVKVRDSGDFNQSASIFKQALDDAIYQNAPNTAIANAEGLLGQTYQLIGKNVEGKKLLIHAISIMEMNIPPDWQSVATYSNSLGLIYRDQGHYRDAMRLHAKVVKLYETYLSNSKVRTIAYPIALHNLSIDYHELAQYQNAQVIANKALEFSKHHPGKHKASYAIMLLQSSWTYTYQGNYSQAENMIRKSMVLNKSNVEALGIAYGYLAWVVSQEGKYEEAEALYDKALTSKENLYGKYSQPYLSDLINKAKILVEQGKFEQARPLAQEANTLMGVRNIAILHGDLLYDLGKIAQHDKDYDAAEQYFKQAIAVEQSVTGPIHRHHVRYHHGLAELYAEVGKQEAAISHYQQAIAMQQKVAPQTHPDLAKIQKSLNDYLVKTSASLPTSGN